MRKLYLILLLVPCTIFSQTHSIDNTNLQASGQPTDFDITKSTFYNAYDTCEVSWVLITDSMPAQWIFHSVFLLATRLELQVLKIHLCQQLKCILMAIFTPI